MKIFKSLSLLLAVAGALGSVSAHAVSLTAIGCGPTLQCTQPAQDTISVQSFAGNDGTLDEEFQLDAEGSSANGAAVLLDFTGLTGTLDILVDNVSVFPAPIDFGTQTNFTIDPLNASQIIRFVVADAGIGAGFTATIQAVPLPAAAWLFISALAGLGIIGRKRQTVVS